MWRLLLFAVVLQVEHMQAALAQFKEEVTAPVTAAPAAEVVAAVPARPVSEVPSAVVADTAAVLTVSASAGDGDATAGGKTPMAEELSFPAPLELTHQLSREVSA